MADIKDTKDTKTTTDGDILNECQKMIDTLNTTKGTNDKIRIMRESFAGLKPLIQRIWDPNTKTSVTLKGINDFKKKDACNGADFGLIELFDKLTSRAVTGDKAKAAIWCVIRKYPKHEELIKKIYEKNLRMRMGEKLIMLAFPGIFKIFEVALASDFDEKRFLQGLAEHQHRPPPAYISKKIDGVRVITEIIGENITFYSRTGQKFTSLEILKPAIRDLVRDLDTKSGVIIDGEVIMLDDQKKENFKLTVSAIRQKDKQMTAPIYRVFDTIPLAVFQGFDASEYLFERYALLQKMFKNNKSDTVMLLEQTPYTAEAFDALKAQAKKEGWEGLMIRFNHTYEGKRSKYLMKYKFFETEEFKVVELGVEIMPFPNASGGEDFKKAMRNAQILYKGDPVWVGSGFSTDERIKYAEQPDLIVGKLITVRYQEPFQDAETGKWSLRIPTFLGIVGDERDF